MITIARAQDICVEELYYCYCNQIPLMTSHSVISAIFSDFSTAQLLKVFASSLYS